MTAFSFKWHQERSKDLVGGGGVGGSTTLARGTTGPQSPPKGSGNPRARLRAFLPNEDCRSREQGSDSYRYTFPKRLAVFADPRMGGGGGPPFGSANRSNSNTNPAH